MSAPAGPVAGGRRAPGAVCVVGSANWDLVARAERLPRPGETVLGRDYAEHAGGKGLNQAVAVARAGAPCAFVGCVGDDSPGAELRHVLERDGVDCRRLAVRPAATGRALIGVDDDGENSIIVVPGANAGVDTEVIAAAADVIGEAAVVLAQLEVPLASVAAALAAARAGGAVTVLDPAPATPLPPELLALCDVLVPNEHELAVLGATSDLLHAGVGAVVVTLGSRGAEVVTPGGTDHVDPFTVAAVDTTAAGDAFCGAMCARLAGGASLAEAVRFGAAAGALAATVPGAVPSLPTLGAIERLLATSGR